MEINIKKRNDIKDEFKWNMQDVYSDESLWEEDYKKVEKLIKKLPLYKGKICENVKLFEETLTLVTSIEMIVEKLYFYANQKYYENLGEGKYQLLSDKSEKILTDFYTASSFVEPELLEENQEKIFEYIEKNDSLKDYKQYFNDLFRQKKHILDSETEELISKVKKFSSGASEIFSVFNNVDLKFPTIKDEKGNEVKLTHSKFSLFLESMDREVRENAFKALYGSYSEFKNTLSAIYINNLKKDSFYADVRKFNSTREMFLEDSNIPSEVYDNLISTVNDNLHLLHRYMKIKKKQIEVPELHLYDVYVPMVESVKKSISYEVAKIMVYDGLKPMGEEYIGILKEGFENGWIDVYENDGKRSGAYSWTTYGVHPYVLLNFQPNLNNVFTIAHEMGHAIHSYYSNKCQSYTNAGYKIFVAEVASICNESLLINHLINNSDDKLEKAYLINHFLEQFRTTLFRQTMFAEFEDIVHKMTDNNESLNADKLCEIYYELNKKYFGNEVVIDKEIEMEWARIPHFYNSFYVYQYATGFSAAVALSKKIMEEGESAVEDYKKFLKAGCSDYPIEILKLAGVDMAKKEPIVLAMKMFEKLLDEFEELMEG